jgi:DinB superfamily
MTTPDTAAATLARFDHAWEALDKTVKSLDRRALTEIRDPAGWSAKDHLMHLALWEQTLVASKADGRPRHEVLGLDPSTDGSQDWDTLNAAIFARTRDASLADVLRTLQETHDTTRARLLTIAHGGAAAERTHSARALLEALPDYIDHYDQHRGWIETLVANA